MFGYNDRSAPTTIMMLVPSTSQPRIIKRVSQVNEVWRAKIVGFSRSYYNINKFDQSIPTHIIGHVRDKMYIYRIFGLVRLFFYILFNSKSKPPVYAFSLDLLLVAFVLRCRLVCYEIGDLRTCDRPNGFFAVLERFLVRRVERVVITSKYYYEDYFRSYGFEKDKFIVLENKCSLSESKIKRKDDFVVEFPIRIGLIGFFRYEKSIRMIVDFVERSNGKFALVCHGDGPCRYLLTSSKCKFITYNGPFASPEALESIYSTIDINYVVYDSHSKNVKLAMPNKFYESLYFRVPIIAACDTALARTVASFCVGIELDLSDQVKFDRVLNLIDSNLLKNLTRNCESMDPSIYSDDTAMIVRRAILKNKLSHGHP